MFVKETTSKRHRSVTVIQPDLHHRSQNQTELRDALNKTRRTQSRVMDVDRLKVLIADIRDDLAIVRLLHKAFENPSLSPPLFRVRTAAIDRKLAAIHEDVCDIAELANALGNSSRAGSNSQSVVETLVIQMSKVHAKLRSTDEEEAEILFEGFWQYIGFEANERSTAPSEKE